MSRTRTPAAVLGAALLLGACGQATPRSAENVGVDERIGETVPLDDVTLIGEAGEPVALRSLFDVPVVLAPVYYRCAGICTPLLQELARVLPRLDELKAGRDYRVVTVSIDPNDTPEMASHKRDNTLAKTDGAIGPDGWRFLTGKPDALRKLAKSVGYSYIFDGDSTEFVHVASLVFVGADGKIARYLGGTKYNPADLKMAILDATAGRARSFMHNLERLCYTFEPDARGYVVNINRIILAVTLLFAAGLAFVLVGTGRRRTRVAGAPTGEHAS